MEGLRVFGLPFAATEALCEKENLKIVHTTHFLVQFFCSLAWVFFSINVAHKLSSTSLIKIMNCSAADCWVTISSFGVLIKKKSSASWEMLLKLARTNP